MRGRGIWSPAAAVLLVLGCGGSDTGDAGDRANLSGAGATFPYILYSDWVNTYTQRTPGVRINYQSIGSGGGIRQISEQTVDFGASDGPMSDEELQRARGGELLHIPMVLGAVAIAYNIPGVTDTLRFDADLIANIFLGKITRWNDPRVATLNPNVALPDLPVVVVHRSEGSGTTYVFTEFLTKSNAEWAAGPGHGKDVQWPVGLGGLGNEQVSGQVDATPGAIGYIESVYALQNQVLTGKVKNPAGNFVPPTAATISAAAAETAAQLPPDTDYRVSIVNAPGENAYPIASFTWLLVYRKQSDAAKGRALQNFLRWAVTEGQETAVRLNYGPLPESMRPALLQRIESLEIPQGG